MNQEPIVFINHILESIEKIESYLTGISKVQFLKDAKDQDAVIRRIEIIGEAAKNILPSFKEKYPSIEWKLVMGTRDKVIHHYFGVDFEMVWDIVKNDLPKLKEQLLKIKK